MASVGWFEAKMRLHQLLDWVATTERRAMSDLLLRTGKGRSAIADPTKT
jgi:hypothetical protein